MTIKLTERQQRANEEAEYIVDFLDHATTQKPRLTLMYYYDGTDQFITQMFLQTRLPDTKLTRLYLIAKAFIECATSHYPPITLKDIIVGLFKDSVTRQELVWDLFEPYYMIHSFAIMTEAEAEMQANVEAHSYHYRLFEPSPTTFKFGDREFRYPAITEDEYIYFNLKELLTMPAIETNKESENVSA